MSILIWEHLSEMGVQKKMAISQNKRGNSMEDFSDKGEMHLTMMGSGAPQGSQDDPVVILSTDNVCSRQGTAEIPDNQGGILPSCKFKTKSNWHQNEQSWGSVM